ncbi:MAG: hypothetical protein Ctma_0617 [Catillopecten margaritatus gill symbiont]|uniref:Uncharacterized protein n=1 Tax=Catillopecten margaritatus gill symbiont TaxID=3083288 RepID=A0AAU6PFW5_9GAMM
MRFLVLDAEHLSHLIVEIQPLNPFRIIAHH